MRKGGKLMKKKITFLTSIFIIAMLLFTSSVFAAETFTYEGSTYVIDEVKLKLDSLSDDVECWGMDTNNNYVYFDYVNSKFYKVTETECTVMSSQEILDLMNNKYYIHNFIDDNTLNIYQEKLPVAGIQEEGYIITEDKIVDENKVYLERGEIQEGENISIGYKIVTNPDLENGTYYERVPLITPKTAKIDEKISYYKYDSGLNIFVRVGNPKEEDIYMYAIIGEAEKREPTKIGTMSQEVYDKIFLMENSSHLVVYDEENGEIYIFITYEERKKSVIYKADGTIVKEYDSLMEIEVIGNEFFVVALRDEHWNIDDSKITIKDKEGNTVHETTNLPYLETLDYGKYTTYLKNYDYDVNEFYNMYEYELLSQDSQKYEGKELQIKTSGELDRLTSVKVNGVELDATNYNKTSGSTIITLKNDYLKTLSKGNYTLEVGYVDGVTLKTTFVIENDPINTDTSTENDKGEKDDTPKTGNTTEDSNLGLYIILIIAIIGAVATSKKIK